MNIVLGVCGIGFGHCFRQLPIINYLIEKKHNLVLFTFNNSYYFFLGKFPNIPIYNIWAPWIHGSHSGIDFTRTANEKFNLYEGAYEKNFSIMGKVLNSYKKIDLFISDYEPITAQFAYATNTKLITIDQQSKYLGFDFPMIGDYSPEDERNRLNLFFPFADERIALSFFKLQNLEKDSKFNVVNFPSLAREEVKHLKNIFKDIKSNDILVYLSPHSQTIQSIEQLVTIFQTFKNYRFIIYTKTLISYPSSNIIIESYNFDDFSSNLAKSKAIITTAGHNILSDAVFLKKPVFVIPLETYEQYYNADIISKEGLGMKSKIIYQDELQLFLKNLDEYRHNLINCELLKFPDDENYNVLTHLQDKYEL